MGESPPDIERVSPYSFLSQRLRRIDGSHDKGGKKSRQEQPEAQEDVVELHSDGGEEPPPDEDRVEPPRLDLSA